MDDSFAATLARIRACTVCAPHLPLGPRPILRASPTARLLIVGQAPGTKVHETGIPWNDRSGDRLREWLGLDRDTFYDESRIAIVPTGLCYPGRDPRGGDLPPRPECAPLWHPVILPLLTEVRLTLAVGSHAQAVLLKDRRRGSMTETVAAWRDTLPGLIPLPHPSWRTTAWQRKNPWFDTDLLPDLRARVGAVLAGA
ncbi:MAG: uracil-DNA glycosylase family protein [Bacteroidota bacterium]